VSSYTYKRYYEEALFWYDSIEDVDSDSVITATDAGVTPLEWSFAIGEARREVLQVCAEASLEWVSRNDSFVFPAGDSAALDPPGSFLPYVPLSITRVSVRRNGIDRPCGKLHSLDEWRQQAFGGVSVDLVPPYLFIGRDIRIYGIEGQTVTVEYIPTPEHIAPGDLSLETVDQVVPYTAQHAVSVFAALNVGVKDGSATTQLREKAAMVRQEIKSAAGLRNQGGPTYIAYTRPRRRHVR